MSFPSSGIESFYRNPIEQVQKYLQQNHKCYMIFNLSNRKYDYSYFNNQVIDQFGWEDHNAPELYKLFIATAQAIAFLQKNEQNVVIVHCQAGKGRTGMLICCILGYLQQFNNVEQANMYFAKKRFNNNRKYGVSHPSQQRYVNYLYSLIHKRLDLISKQQPTPKYFPKTVLLQYIEIIGTPNYNSNSSCKPIIYLTDISNKQIQFNNKESHANQATMYSKDQSYHSTAEYLKIDVLRNEGLLISGDYKLELHNNGSLMQQLICRTSFNTFFFKNSPFKLFIEDLDPDIIRQNKKVPRHFQINLHFQQQCDCYQIDDPDQQICGLCCKFFNQVDQWKMINFILQNYKGFDKQKAEDLLNGIQN